jgi:hypothetical protein
MQLDTELERRTIASLEPDTAHTHADFTNATVVPDAAVAAQNVSTGNKQECRGSGRKPSREQLLVLRECPSAAACSAQKGYSEANAHNSRRSQLDTIYSAASAKLRVLQYLTCNDHRLAAIVHELALALAVSRICVIRTALRIRLANDA